MIELQVSAKYPLERFENALIEIINPTPSSLYVGFPPNITEKSDTSVKVLPENAKDRIVSEIKKFYGFSEVIWVEDSIISDKNNSPIITKTNAVRETDYDSYKEHTCYLYAIRYTPAMFLQENLNMPVKDGVVISPTYFRPNSFEAIKTLTIEWNPEDFSNKEEEIRALAQKIRNAIYNESEYTPNMITKPLIRFAVRQ